jgi:hypothetical protein
MSSNLGDLLYNEITSALRPSEGDRKLDYALDAMDEGATMAIYSISENPNLSGRLMSFCKLIEGIYYNFQIAKVYAQHQRNNQSRDAISDANRIKEIGLKLCKDEYNGDTGDSFSYLLNFHYQNMLDEISKFINPSPFSTN